MWPPSRISNNPTLEVTIETLKNRLIVAAICVPVLLYIMVFLPAYILTAVVSIICAISSYELQHSIGGKVNERIAIYATFSAVLIPIGTYFDIGALVMQAVILLLMSLMFIEAIIAYQKKRPVTFSHILLTLFGGAVIPYLLSSLISLKNMPDGSIFVLLPFVSAFVTDGGAYFAGKLLGKRKAFPLISPNKTIEGCIGGLVAGIAAMFIYGIIVVYVTLYDINFWALILYGLVGGILTELGDVAFSLIKREYKIKDFGHLLPGHGGILDRFDSMVFTAPAILLLVTVVPLL